jgi:hypothetical protein
MRMSLRKAINTKCRGCTYDPLGAGTAAQQIACCVDSACPLHPVRPITATLIPAKLLEGYHIAPEQLDDKARALVEIDPSTSESGQIGLLLSLEEHCGSASS